MKSIVFLAGLLVAQVVFADRASDIMTNSDLTLAEKHDKVTLTIQDISENGGDVAAFVTRVIDLTPADQQNAMIASVVVAISLVDPSAPKTLATVATTVYVSIGAKVVAAASLSAVKTGLNTAALATALESSGIDAATLSTFTDAAAAPSTVISTVSVTTAQVTVPPLLFNLSDLSNLETDVQQVSISVVNGYGLQTE